MAGSLADTEGRDFSLTSTTTNRSTDEFWYLFPEIPVAIWSETYFAYFIHSLPKTLVSSVSRLIVTVSRRSQVCLNLLGAHLNPVIS